MFSLTSGQSPQIDSDDSVHPEGQKGVNINAVLVSMILKLLDDGEEHTSQVFHLQLDTVPLEELLIRN